MKKHPKTSNNKDSIDEKIKQLRKENRKLKKELSLLSDPASKKSTKNQKNKSKVLDDYYTQALDLFCIMDASGCFININKELELILGYSKKELTGKRFVDFIHPEDIESTLSALNQLTNQKRVTTFANRCKEKDGSYKHIEWHSKCYGDQIYSVSYDITRNARYEKEIQYEKTMIRTLIDNVPDLIYAKDLNARKTMANKSDLSLMGVKSEAEALGKDDFAFYSPDRAAEFIEEDKRVIETGLPTINTEGFHIDEEGRWRWFITSKYPLRDASNKIIGLVGIGRDITEHKLREIEKENLLEKAIKQQTAIISLSTNPLLSSGNIAAFSKFLTEIAAGIMNCERASVWLFDDDSSNFSCINLYELPKNEHTEWMKLNQEEFPNYFKTLREESYINAFDAQNDPCTSEFTETYLKKINVVSILDAPIHFDGKIVGVVRHEQVKTNRKWEPNEITFASQMADYMSMAISNKRKLEAEQKIRANAERQSSLAKLLQSNPESMQQFLDFTLFEGIKITRSKFGYVYHYDENKKEFTLNSWSKDVMKECSVLNPQTCYELDKTGIWGETVRQKKEIIINDFQKSHPLKKGLPEGHVSLNNFLTIPHFQDGQIVAVIGVANKETDYDEADVSNLQFLMSSAWEKINAMKSEEALRVSEATLRELNIAKDKLFSIVAHDLRNSFGIFINLTQIMADDAANMTISELSRYANELNKNANNILKLLRNLLEWAQSQKGTLKYSPTKLSINELISGNIDNQKFKAGQKNISIEYKGDGDVEVYADEKMINSIIRNILSNAIKFTPRGGQIIINTTLSENNYLQVAIKDTGIGIPPELIPRLFKIEEKVSRIGTEGEESSSLGLILCKEFVVKNNGNIWVESKENEGSTFYFTVPLVI